MISNKEAKHILNTHPHKWIFNAFGVDLVCEICGNNMESQRDVCDNCKELRKVFSFSSYEPFWVKLKRKLKK